MVAYDLARQAGQLAAVAWDAAARLNRLTGLAARRVPGCCGATASLWELGEIAATAASHPGLAALAERQFPAGHGPIVAALRSGRPSVITDTLHEERWPEFAQAALAAGVRSAATIAQNYDSVTLTLSLYGLRPNAFDLLQLPLAPVLAAFGTAMMAGAAEYGRMLRTAAQMEEAIRSQAVVDQAKGILMTMLGCEPDEAFDQMRRISQAEQVNLTEVAAKVLRVRLWQMASWRR